MAHRYENHTLKDMCYICKKCSHAECTKAEFVKHLATHSTDVAKSDPNSHLVAPKAPFMALKQCSKCVFKTVTTDAMMLHLYTFHMHMEKEDAKQLSESSSGPPELFENADDNLLTEMVANATETTRLATHLGELSAEKARRRLEPEVLGIKHCVTLRGDLFTKDGAPYAHVYVESMLKNGRYNLQKKHHEPVRSTICLHGSNPMLLPRLQDVPNQNPERFMVSGDLHLARGNPVYWCVLSMHRVPEEGEWSVRGVNGDHVCSLTVRERDVLL